jgi:hypothetical protein
LGLPQPSTSTAPSTKTIVIESLDRLRQAALIFIVGSVIGLVGGVIALALVFRPFVGMFPAYEIPQMVLTAVAVSLAVIVLVALLAIVAVYGYLVPSAKGFASWRPTEFSTPSTLISVGYVWGLVIFIIGLAIIGIGLSMAAHRSPGGVGLILAGAAIAIIGGILGLIGRVGLVIMFFKLRDVFNSSTFLVIAILEIASLIVSFIPYIMAVGGVLGLVEWILVYTETGSIRSRIEAGAIQIQ